MRERSFLHLRPSKLHIPFTPQETVLRKQLHGGKPVPSALVFTRCYGQKCHLPPAQPLANSNVEALTPNVTAAGDGPLGR